MQVKSQRDFWTGLLFIVLGAGFAWGATLYSFGSSARPGPAYFPFGLGVLLALLGAAILFKAVTVDTADGEPFGAVAWRPLLIITGAVLLFAILLPRAGMVISLPVLVIVSSLGSKEFTWTAAIVSSVVLTIFSWLVFIKGLGLTIPLWPVMAAGT